MGKTDLKIDPRTPEIYEEIQNTDVKTPEEKSRVIYEICQKYGISKRDLIIYEKYHYPPKFLIQKPE